MKGRPLRRSLLAPAIFALAAATATAASADPKPIAKIDRVTAAILRGRLVVNAAGAVNSGGWTQPRLHLLPHKPDSDTDVIEFQATPPLPDAVVIQELLPVTTTAVFPPPHAGVTQVKVVGESNAVTAPISSAPLPAAPVSRGR
jgi:hypothetical protein